jgi:hypothetical protein|tara:strand:+ start:99 stop:551 length:453 start_codon:yes stop_codon:yes gene_type:complete
MFLIKEKIMGKFVKKNPHPTKGFGLPPVTPQQVDRVRRSVLDVVRNKIPDVRLVLDGSKKWDNQQVRLFGMMLNKVMPDLHHSFNEHTVENKNMDELTIEELQEIAKQAETLEGEYQDASNESGSGEKIATDKRNQEELPRIREGTSPSV